MSSGEDTLVKYEKPIQVSSAHGGKMGNKKGGAKSVLPQTSATQDALNTILPPREWSDPPDQYWIQYVSSTPATKAEVESLQRLLDIRLKQNKARETGICPAREALYAQCFDELIRQITIICAERGMLLLQVRDEIRMTISAYQSLYESSIAFGMRKALQAEQRRKNQQNEITSLKGDIARLAAEKENLFNDIEAFKNSSKNEADKAEVEHQNEVQNLQANINALRQQLEMILSTPSAAANKANQLNNQNQ